MTIADMRAKLMERYSGTIRGQRVDRMSDRQVIAIYKSLVDRKDIGICRPGIPKRSRLHEPVRYEQIGMEFMNDQAS